MTMYGNSDTKTYASTNGFLSIMQGSSVYQAVALPSSTLPNNTACPFWDDLKLYGASPDQGIFYSFNAAGTTVTYDYLLGRAGVPSEIYHFQVVYSTNAPGVFVYKYISVGSGNNGVDASVGIQGGNGFVQFSLDVADITPGMTITCDTNKSTCVAS
ncbi:hypothetical protein LTR39_002951 [Cryomyces antarcticus]|nr:hypothetical protein LTR39_002951 [Cryomyces antarcticus]